MNKYFAAGYTYDDAVTLGTLWKIADTYQVKIDAGQEAARWPDASDQAVSHRVA